VNNNFNCPISQECLKIAVVGLGYVGLPLSIEFSRTREVIGFDIDQRRIEDLKRDIDVTGEVDDHVLRSSSTLKLTSEIADIKNCNCYIVTVPTPIDETNHPDLTILMSASKAIGAILSKGDLVIYESTVFPGCTEEMCVPELAKESGLEFNSDFYVGYSPERINPGADKSSVRDIMKVTSGSTPDVSLLVGSLYKTIIDAGVYMAESIKVAEAAKVVENTQRDLNIALVNELAIILSRLDIDTSQVLTAAATKWNFLPFSPGLVGGHCISVDPYYLTYKAQQVGYYPEVILAGRRVNNHIVTHIASETVKLMLKNKIVMTSAKVLILGFSFKENCPDIRNSRVADLVDVLKGFSLDLDVYDPQASVEDIFLEYQIPALNVWPEANTYSAVIVAVAHNEFVEMGYQAIRSLCLPNGILYDVKNMFSNDFVDGRL
jgi:UDP-N-acetyl-D-glucosamine/UDP-N-acetyl-D-galactosamine dehydrogenase